MTSAAPFRRHPATILATTLLATLLTGCGGGGGGGSDTAISNSPQPPGNGSATGSQQGNRNGSPPAAGNTGASPAPGGNASPATTTQPVSSAGISGAALAAMLDTRGNGVSPFGPADAVEGSGRWGPKLADARSHKLFITINQWRDPDGYTYPSPGFRENSPYDPGIYRPLSGTARYNATSDVVYRWDTSKNATITYVRHSLGVDITASASQLSINHSLDLNWQLQSGTNAEAGPERSMLLSATSPYQVQKSGLIPFDKPLHRWQNGDAQVQLRVLKGRTAREALLCWDYALPDFARLVCRAWRFADGWKAGDEPARTGYFVEDDRSRHTGETGKLWWFLSEDGTAKPPGKP